MRHCLFIRTDIACQQVDDFCSMTSPHQHGNVSYGTPACYDRQVTLFEGTH